MKLYKCIMLDESMSDGEECIVAVMENLEEQELYYQDKFKARKELLTDSGYTCEEDEVEFWFPYKLDDICYAEEIADGIVQYVCDTDYTSFKFIKPEGR